MIHITRYATPSTVNKKDEDEDMSRMSRHRSLTTASIIVAGALVLASCSSNPKAGSASATSTSTAAVGASAGANLSPLRIGFSNTDAATAFQFPGITQGAQAAADYVNAQLGGIQGHPLQLVVCPVTETPQSNQSCGQQFANDSGIPMAVTGMTLAGGPFYSALASANKPILGGIPIAVADQSAPKNTWFYYGGGNAAYAGMVKYLIDHNLTSVTLINTDQPGGQSTLKIIRDLLQGTAVKLTEARIPPTSADVLPPIQASGAQKADAVLINYQNCLPVAQALQQLGTRGKILAVGSCLTSTVLKQSPGLFENWIQPNYTQLPSAGPGLPDVDTFLANYTKYGKKVPYNTLSEVGWGSIITLTRILNKLGYADISKPTALLNAIESYKGPVTMGEAQMSCPGAAASPSVCTTGASYYVIKNGKPVPLTS
jgi:branched-chain amino acid transport system substrate-binding protein